MLALGIDWATEYHTVKFSTRPGEDQTALRIDNTCDGFLQLLGMIRRRSVGLDAAQVVFAVERPNLRLVDFLLANGFTGYCVDPNRMKGYRARYRPSGPKDDGFDAFVLADILWRDRDQLSAITPESVPVQRLKDLLRDRSGFVCDQVSLSNRLTACLREYYPAMLKMFTVVTGKTAMAFIEAYPNLECTRTLNQDRLQAFLVKHHSFSRKRLREMLGVLACEPIPVPPTIVESRQKLALHLIRSLRAAQDAIVEYDGDIKQAMAGNPEIERFATLPGAGPVITSTLYTLLGDDRNRYQCANEVQSYVGTVPRTIQSGKFCRPVFRFACRQQDRAVLTRWAFGAVRVCLWAKKYYNRKRKEGKGHYYALRCLANILLKIAFVMWRDRTDYNEDHYLAQVARHRMNSEGATVSNPLRIGPTSGQIPA
jgi:transposase